jgi:MacB-like periplasmic core domain
MDRLHVFAARLLGLFRKRRIDENLDAELRAHLELLTDENIRRGMKPEEAHYAARRQFGGVEQAKEAYRERRGLPLVESVLQDLRYGVRILRKNPVFTLTAVLTLALGIGANAAVFSLVDAVLLRPMPYRQPNRLLLLSETLPKQGNDELGVSVAEYFDYRDQNHVFSQVAAYETDGLNLTGEGTPLRIHAARLSASAFPLLGVNAIVGRTFTDDEDHPGVSDSHGPWRRSQAGRLDDPKTGRPSRIGRMRCWPRTIRTDVIAVSRKPVQRPTIRSTHHDRSTGITVWRRGSCGVLASAAGDAY